MSQGLNPDLRELIAYNREAARRECKHLEVIRGYCNGCKSWLTIPEQYLGIWNRGDALLTWDGDK